MSSRLSIIIATKDRPDELSQCLHGLCEQHVPPGTLEVVVVDDGSTADLRPVVDAARGRGLDVRSERQESKGLSAARNRGTAGTSGSVVAYLDDDAVPDRHWAARVIQAFEKWRCDGLAGRIRLRLASPAPEWIQGRMWRYLSELDLGPNPLWLEGRELPYGANCAVTREAFERVGGFREGLGRAGGSLISHDETDFFERVRASGGRIAYAPGAVVEHLVASERLTLGWFLRRAHGQGFSTVLLENRLSPRNGSRHSRALREALGIARVLPEAGRDLLYKRGLAGTRIYIAYWRGRLEAARAAG